MAAGLSTTAVVLSRGLPQTTPFLRPEANCTVWTPA